MPHNIAVTGTGGGIGQSIIKSLYNTDYNVIALDGEPLGAGLYSTPTSYLIPYATDPEYITRLLNICEKENIHLLFPGMDAELKYLAEDLYQFSLIGTIVAVSNPEVIEIADNKLLMYEKLKDSNINFKIPKTISAEYYYQLNCPFIVKPKIGGARSKNVSLIKSKEELFIWSKMNIASDYIAQEYIEGDEYTCGTISFGSSCRGVIVMRRILRDGDTYKCFTERNKLIEEAAEELINIIKPFGACNVQLRLKDGIPYILEINARCSGTTAARTLCGFNEPKMIADYLLKGIEPKYDIKEQTILRYWNELVVNTSDIIEMGIIGHRAGEVKKLWQ